MQNKPNTQPTLRPTGSVEKTTGFKHLLRSTTYSMKGLKSAFLNESAFRQELSLVVIMIPLAIWLAPSKIEGLLMIASLLLVLIVELLNSAVEAVVDRVSTEFHELSGLAKDLGSASVFISLVLVGVTWGTILFL